MRNVVVLQRVVDFDAEAVFTPSAGAVAAANAMTDQLVRWGGALRAIR